MSFAAPETDLEVGFKAPDSDLWKAPPSDLEQADTSFEDAQFVPRVEPAAISSLAPVTSKELDQSFVAPESDVNNFESTWGGWGQGKIGVGFQDRLKPEFKPLTQAEATAANKAAWEAFKSPQVEIPKIPIGKDDNTYIAAGKQLVNVALSVPEFFSSPLGMTALAAGMVAPTAVAAAFTVDMLHSLGQQIVETYGNVEDMTPAQMGEAAANIVGTGWFARAAGTHAIKGINKSGNPLDIPGRVGREISGQLTEEPFFLEKFPVEQQAALGGQPVRRFMEPGEELLLRDELGEPVPITGLTAAEVAKTSSPEIQVAGQPPGTKQTLPTRGPTPEAPATTKAQELMTPEEFDAFVSKKQSDAQAVAVNEARQRLAAGELVDPSKISVAVENERGALSNAIKNNQPVNAALFDRYNKNAGRPLKLPEGYVLEGEQYVYKPTQTIAPPKKTLAQKVAELPKEEVAPEPMTPRTYSEADLKTFQELTAKEGELLKEGTETVAYKSNRSEIEALKNKYGGNRPAEAPAPVAQPTVAKAETVEAKIESEIKKVAAAEGIRPAKEIKSELIQKLEQAIKDAPPETLTPEQMEDIVQKRFSAEPSSDFRFRVKKMMEDSGHKEITIDIPGDGSFTVWNTKENLQNLLAKAKKISTSSDGGKGFTERGSSKEDKAWVAEQIREQRQRADEMGEPETQGAIASGVPPLSPISAPVQLTPKSQRQIITDLAKGLKVPIRFGRLTTNKFAGYFKSFANLIGAKKANQIPLVSHEVGHKLDSTFKLSGDRSIAVELDTLGDPATPGSYSSWTKSKTIKYKMGEGVAEFTRLWLTDPAKALADAPNTHRAFEAALNANKDFGDVMRQAQEDIRIWRTAEPQARLRSHISIGTNPNKTPYTISQLTRDLIDDLHFGRLAVDDAQRMAGRTLDPSENFYLLARNLRGSYGMADTFIRSGTADFKTKEVTLGTSLQDALKPVSGRINDFRDWIVAKQAQELHRAGKQTGLVDADVNFTADKFNADPAFQETFTKIKAWNDSLLQYSVDSGLTTADGAAAMRRMNADYVPFHRVFEIGAGEAPSVEGGTGRGLNVGKPGSLMGRHGSARDIVDPLETMVRNAYTLITASEKSAINIAVADLSRSPGMGKWIEKIATPQQNIKVGIEKLKQQLEDAGADLTNVPDDLLLNFFQNSGKAPFGENTIKIVRDGKPEFYRLNKDLFDTFNALDLEDSGKLIRMLSSPAQLLRSGVTLAPDFSLANAFRDTFSAAIISKYNAFPFEVTMRGFSAMIGNPKLVSEWAAAGGKNSVEANYFDRTKLQNFLKERITKDLTPAEQALVIAKSPLTALRFLTGAFEEATRIGEYQKAFNSLTKSGMPEGEARRLAAFESRDRQDFAKGGAKIKIVRHMAAFWNAQLQANVRLAQAFKERPLQTIGKGLLFITTAKLLEQAVNWDDKDYWDRPQWERDLFFLIPIGKGDDGHTRFIRLPTPFELGVIFGTLPGRVLQWAKENNSDAVKDFPSLMLKQTVPNPIPQTLQMIFSDFLSGKKGWDVWRGRQVVPESIANNPPEMQWTEQTSLTARKLGKLLKFSPVKIDHIISSSTGGVGQLLTHQISDRAISLATGEKRTAQGKIPGGRFVTSPASVASRANDDFYETLEKLRTETKRKQQGGVPTMNINLTADFERTADTLSKIRKAIRETDSESRKQQLREQHLRIVRNKMLQYRKQTQR